MIIQLLNEAKKRIEAPKKAPVKKKVVSKKPAAKQKGTSSVPSKLADSFGEEITANLKKYIEGRIEKGLYNDTIIGQIPDNVIFFVFDTETRNAVKKFQLDNKIKADGIFGSSAQKIFSAKLK
jgi:peptidoglycan hydrolase-like protein with peptidoglycan-binding domain